MVTLRIITGIFVLLLIGFIFSVNKKNIRVRPVIGAFFIQAVIGAFILYVPVGQSILAILTRLVASVIEYSGHGISFLFGDLVGKNKGFIFAFQVLPIMIFFSSLMSVLYYIGIIQKIVKIFGSGVRKVLGTSSIESTAAASNIFVGNVDVFIMVKPYVRDMTDSELFALMTGGFSSIAGSVLVGYAAMGIDINLLLTAAFMSAPGGLLFAKLIFPETSKLKERVMDIYPEGEKPVNIIEAATSGAFTGLKVAASVGVMLLALISLIALVNGFLSYIGGFIGYGELSLEMIFGYIFAPLAWLLGIPVSEVMTVGNFLGQKIVLNEFVAFMNLSRNNSGLSPHSEMILIMALAGFANLSAPAAMLGVLGNFVPERKKFIARMALRVILGATLANLLSAAIISLYMSISA
ncbi:NupC/NupG family nucleoside CNT transporter [Salmonella enterica subsp. enterica serovar Abony]|nr:NupC/NupG family nucleoside CNT transporter [Salmonella enterica subsp. enterica serovar Richmond]EBX6497336.1 NupC/NupG family nucleoside CNT transporter [Salmonella enterica subsp. enterica serovar Abony]EJB5403152.1 NupC/NupG family nucleoside CNT transporter [Salmonella enterica]ELH0791642.1 NupC/NupG family nucleoside CNT transporter [Salmonella enterica]HAK7672434.1 NupC/NupG family nucleoside CNT transporter [Salmonella enterica]